MTANEIKNRIQTLEEELTALPVGSCVIKVIKGREQPYLQWSENGKSKSRYIKKDEREKIMEQLDSEGYRYFFIDEVTLMEDFIDSASLFSENSALTQSASTAPLPPGAFCTVVRSRRLQTESYTAMSKAG